MPDRFFLGLTTAIALLAWPLPGKAQRLISRNEPAPVAPAPAAAVPFGASPYGAPSPYGAAVGPMSADLLDPNRKLRQGDQLMLKIEQDRDGAIPVVVSQTGDVLVEPLPHGVHIAGMTLTAAQQEIKRQLEKDYYHVATVRLTLSQANERADMATVQITGNVNHVGPLQFSQAKPLTLSQAVNTVGGFARYADNRKVRVTRVVGGTPKTYVVDVKEIQTKGRVDLDMPLQDGDMIFVPETFFQP
jgi:polysaccharide biosynthesis/export protein